MNRSHFKAWVLMVGSLGVLFYAQPIAAQVIPDATLPAGERSQVTGNPNAQIDGGARRGGNLFHSFSQFSIPTGGSAYFNNAADVQNIFSRVTGGSISTIDGLIRANGTANLFLLNPNGILFGPNASLNIGGSFVATTANAIGFPNGEKFSSDATQPLPSQLLTVNPNALLFNQLAAQAIINQSTANNGTGLRVPAGQSLLLVGGDVRLEGGQIVSPASHVEIGAFAGQASLGLSEIAGDWRLSFPDGVARADVSLSNSAGINVLAGGGGSIAMTARNLTLNEGSTLSAGINQGLGFTGASAGDIHLDVAEAITLADSSQVRSEVGLGGTGNAGNINITTGALSLTGSSQLISITKGQGNVGNVNVNARNTVSLDSGVVFNNVDPIGIGNAGDINITASSLSITNGGQLNTLTFGRGRSGNVKITVRDASFDGVNSNDIQSGVLTGVVENAVGQGGNVSITADSLSLSNGAILSALTFGQGDAGNININVRDAVLLNGSTARGGGGIFTTVTRTGVGSGGIISLRAGSLSIIGDAAIAADTNGQGPGGNINLDVKGTLLLNGGKTASTGESSRITLGVQPAGMGVQLAGKARGGDLHINAGSLVLTNGGFIKASTQGQGDAGNIDIRVNIVDISGSVPSSGLLSGLFTSSDTAGNAGDITIDTQTFRIADGAALSARSRGDGRGGDITVNAARTFEAVSGGQLITTTFGQGQAGSITVNAREQLTIASSDPNYADRLAKFPNPIDPLVASAITETGPASGLFANTEPNSTGRGGDIQIATRTLNIQNQAEVTVSSSGTGSAGNLFVDANRIFLNNQGRIRADTTGGGGNINLRSPLILLRNGSNITTNARGSDIPGGNITIDTRFLVAVRNEDSNISANSEDFRGGNIRINAVALYGIQPRPFLTSLSDITATGATSALSGTIDVITAGIDPTAGLLELPTDLADSSGLIAQGCPANQGNSFVITGRGGLPPTPEQQLDDDAEWSDRRRLVVGQQADREGHGDTETRGREESDANLSASPRLPLSASSSPHTPIIEATRIHVTSTGEVFLVADTPNLMVQNPLNQPVACQGRR